MKIELDLPQVPDGWRSVGIKITKNGQARINYNGNFEILEGSSGYGHYLAISLGYMCSKDLSVEAMRAEAKQLLGVKV